MDEDTILKTLTDKIMEDFKGVLEDNVLTRAILRNSLEKSLKELKLL